MQIYDDIAQKTAALTMRSYSTSFSRSTRLFPRSIRRHIYNIYALVRIADEIVDSYIGKDAGTLLDELEQDVYRSMKLGYSANPIVHAFSITARAYNITALLIKPFFVSMRMDLTIQIYTQKKYNAYIHGSAEVVGLMCLHVYCEHDVDRYESLKDGAIHLGAAYQKVNFLRDLASDSDELGRVYFPGYSIDSFDEAAKQAVVSDIMHDLDIAYTSIPHLPVSARRATRMSALYYEALLHKLSRAPIETIKLERIRVSNWYKLWLYLVSHIQVMPS